MAGCGSISSSRTTALTRLSARACVRANARDSPLARRAASSSFLPSPRRHRPASQCSEVHSLSLSLRLPLSFSHTRSLCLARASTHGHEKESVRCTARRRGRRRDH